jgi:hypothetical protein
MTPADCLRNCLRFGTCFSVFHEDARSHEASSLVLHLYDRDELESIPIGMCLARMEAIEIPGAGFPAFASRQEACAWDREEENQ